MSIKTVIIIWHFFLIPSCRLFSATVTSLSCNYDVIFPHLVVCSMLVT